MANLDDNAVAKKLLLARAEDASAKGLVVDLRHLLDKLNLPTIAALLKQHPYKPETWKRFTKKQIRIKSFLKFMDDCEHHHIGDCESSLAVHFSTGVSQWALSRANSPGLRRPGKRSCPFPRQEHSL